MYHLAILGSRNYAHLDLVAQFILSITHEEPNITIHTGDARGVDRAVCLWAARRALKLQVHSACWHTQGRAAGVKRTFAMLQECNEMIAFWDESSKGTAAAIDYALAKDIPFTIYGKNGVILPKQPLLY